MLYALLGTFNKPQSSQASRHSRRGTRAKNKGQAAALREQDETPEDNVDRIIASLKTQVAKGG